uniref:Gamma-interferon-inducible lysosomal thiol reductase n=1 Tax=Leersia perrieri TaxID=77586 RepID=A0A0D9VSY6_9ORYZ
MDAQRRRVLLVALVSAVAAVAAGALLPQPRAEAAAEKVPLALYYETLCPYCSRFIVNHLAGIFEDGLIAAVDLRLVPYGNAHVVGANNTITCQSWQRGIPRGPHALITIPLIHSTTSPEQSLPSMAALHHYGPLLLFIAALVIGASATVDVAEVEINDGRVDVALYYESLCPYSAKFVVDNLAKVFKDGLLSSINLSLVPYGNARVRDGKISCQHGSQECFLNTVEACAIDAWPDLRVHFRFIYCVEELVVNHKQQEWESCFAKLNLDPKPVTDCYKSERGHQLSLKYGRQTDALQPPHKYVPWVVVDGQPLYEDYENFESYICKAYKGQPPKVCKGLRMLATESVTTTLGDMKLRPDEDDQTRPRSRRRFEGSADHLLKELLWPYSFKTYAEKAFLWVANQKNPLLCPHLPSHQVSATE